MARAHGLLTKASADMGPVPFSWRAPAAAPSPRAQLAVAADTNAIVTTARTPLPLRSRHTT
jgi:hypothetical protein